MRAELVHKGVCVCVCVCVFRPYPRCRLSEWCQMRYWGVASPQSRDCPRSSPSCVAVLLLSGRTGPLSHSTSRLRNHCLSHCCCHRSGPQSPLVPETHTHAHTQTLVRLINRDSVIRLLWTVTHTHVGTCTCNRLRCPSVSLPPHNSPCWYSNSGPRTRKGSHRLYKHCSNQLRHQKACSSMLR